jgi:hypothetical protein
MKYRFGLAGVASLAVLTALSGGAFAATFEYGSYSVIGDTNVVINAGPVQGTFGSGQIDLFGTGANAGQTLKTWCIDAFDELQGSGTYSIISPPFNNHGGQSGSPVIGSTALSEIASLVHYGDTNIGTSYVSPAVQLAIWDVEYSGLGYTFTSTDGNVNNLVTTLVGDATGNELAPLSTAYLREVIAVNSDGKALNQGLVFEVAPVPLPAALPLLGSVFAGLGAFGWVKGRRKSA